jgi:transcriptional regulator with XRE-family HTH domain
MYKIGDLIKYERKAKGLSQEELSDGICSVSNLSRIESNEQAPTRQKLQAILERLGITGDYLLPFATVQEVKVLEIEREINHYILKEQDSDKAKKKLEEIATLKNEGEIYDIYLTFLEIFIAEREGRDLAEMNQTYQILIGKLIPDFTPEKIMEKPRSKKEFTILNGYTLNLLHLGQTEQSGAVSKSVVTCIEKWVDDKDALSGVYTDAAYYFSTALLIQKKFCECLEVTEQSLVQLVKFEAVDLTSYSARLYNKGKCLVELGMLAEARRVLVQAYYVVESTGLDSFVEIINGENVQKASLLEKILDFAQKKGIESWV